MLHLYTSECVWLQCTWLIIYNVRSAHPWGTLLPARSLSRRSCCWTLCHWCPFFLSVSVSLQLSPVSSFLCVSVFLPLFSHVYISLFPFISSSFLPHLSASLPIYLSCVLFTQWHSAVTDSIQTRVSGCGLKATHNHKQAHSLSLTYKDDYTSHVGNLHRSICSLTLKFTYRIECISLSPHRKTGWGVTLIMWGAFLPVLCCPPSTGLFPQRRDTRMVNRPSLTLSWIKA